MATLHTTDEVATLLGITPRSVRRLAAGHGIGTLITARTMVYTDEEVAMIASHSTGKPGRPPRERIPGMPASQLAALLRQGKIRQLTDAKDRLMPQVIEGWDLTGWETREVPGALLWLHWPPAAAKVHANELEIAGIDREIAGLARDERHAHLESTGNPARIHDAHAARNRINALRQRRAELVAAAPVDDRRPVEAVLCVNADPADPRWTPAALGITEDGPPTIILYRPDWLAPSDIPVTDDESPF